MFDNIDPAKKQYFIFCAIVSIILSGIVNFFFIDILKGSFAYGFPIGLTGLVGIGAFFARLINSIVLGLILTPMLYYFIQWLQHRGSGDY